MKKKISKLTLFILYGLILLAFSGCGALLNGNKQLTDDKLISIDDDGDGLSIDTIYYVEDSRNAKSLVIIFSSYTSIGDMHLLSLSKTGNTLNYVTSTGVSDNHFFTSCSVESYESLSDAYMIGKRDIYNSNFPEVSNIIMKDDIITIKAQQPETWENRDIVYTKGGTDNIHVYAGKFSSYKPNGNPYSSYRYDYLWVKLSENCWFCMGEV